MRPSTLLSIEAACFFLQTILSMGQPSPMPDASFRRAKRQNFNEIGISQKSESNLFIDEDVDDASTGKAVPNSWLYRFPPWFLPHNPPPDGFATRGGNEILNQIKDAPVEQQRVEDGDVIIVSDFLKSNRRGRLHNVKIPGGTLYQDQVIQTIVDFSLGNKQQDGHSPVQGIVFEEGGTSVGDGKPGINVQNGITIQDEAPLVIPQVHSPIAPLPPINIPHRTVVTGIPKSQNNDGVFINNDVNVGGSPGNIRISSHFVNNNLQPDVITKFGDNVQKLDTGGFRPSPPDLSFNRLQSQINKNPISTFPNSEFNRSPSGTPNNHKGLPVHGQIRIQGPRSFSKPSQANSRFRPPPHNSIGSGLIKNNRQQTSTLSDFISHNNNNNNNQRRPLWVPLVPNVSPTANRSGRISSLPFGQTQQTFQGQQFQRGKQGIRNHHSNGNSRIIQTNSCNDSPSHPTSIQDIINSNYDTAQILQGRERNSGDALIFPPSGTSSGNIAQQNGRWLWQKSS